MSPRGDEGPLVPDLHLHPQLRSAQVHRQPDGLVHRAAHQAGDVRRQGMALGNLGAALEADGRIEEAVDAYEQSADLLKQVGESEFRANVMQSLSRLQLRTGRQFEALATMEAGLEGIERPNTQQRFLKKLLKLPYKYMGKS